MFEAIKLRMYIAKIQAELKAQYNDQAFEIEYVNYPL